MRFLTISCETWKNDRGKTGLWRKRSVRSRKRTRAGRRSNRLLKKRKILTTQSSLRPTSLTATSMRCQPYRLTPAMVNAYRTRQGSLASHAKMSLMSLTFLWRRDCHNSLLTAMSERSRARTTWETAVIWTSSNMRDLMITSRWSSSSMQRGGKLNLILLQP